MKKKINDICIIATHYGWDYFDYNDNNKMLSLVKDGMRINVFITKMTVAIVINRKQYFVKLVSMEKLEKIFINPQEYCK